MIIEVERGVSTRDLTFDIEQALTAHPLSPGFWFSIGARYSIRDEEKLYRRFRGMNDVSVHSRKMTRANILDSLLILRNKVLSGLAKKYRRKAEYLYVRIRWNPEGERPARSGGGS